MSRKLSESKQDTVLRSRTGMYGRLPLKVVVADCERRWFEATLKAAKSGDVMMQVLVGQMFCAGYGVASDLEKGKYWLRKSVTGNEDASKLLANLSVGEAGDISGLDSKERCKDR